MKYEQPYGVTDPNASYINGNPAAGIQGSIPPAAAFENPMREIVAMIAGGGFTPSDSDLQQVLRAVRSQLVNYCVDQGTLSNNYLAAFNPAIITYSAGMPFRLLVKNSNTGDSSFDAGAGRHQITRYGGAVLSAGDMPASSIAELVWNANQSRFELMNYAGVGTVGSPPPVTVSGLVNVQLFTASGTYTPTTGATRALAFATAAGGGGTASCALAYGGGAGGTAISLVLLAGVPTIPVTIGAGGAGGDPASGQSGGSTSFGTYALATGGGGGQALSTYPSTEIGAGGMGGAGTTGLVLIKGGDGQGIAGLTHDYISGLGGASFWGGGGGMVNVSGTPTPSPGKAFGSGGGAGDAPVAFGVGANGVVLVLEF
jgi:hypothetical protein